MQLQAHTQQDSEMSANLSTRIRQNTVFGTINFAITDQLPETEGPLEAILKDLETEIADINRSIRQQEPETQSSILTSTKKLSGNESQITGGSTSIKRTTPLDLSKRQTKKTLRKNTSSIVRENELNNKLNKPESRQSNSPPSSLSSSLEVQIQENKDPLHNLNVYIFHMKYVNNM